MGITLAMLRELKLLVKPLKTKIANSIASAVIENVDDDKKLQILQLTVLDGETVEDCQRFQEFGFTSVPIEGAEAVVFFPNGDRGNPFVIGVEDRRHRPVGGTAGETMTYNAFSAMMHHKADGTTEITGGGAAAELATKATVDALKSVFNGWTPVPNDGGAALKTALASWTPAGTTKLKGE